jgi:hypothetical protein
LKDPILTIFNKGPLDFKSSGLDHFRAAFSPARLDLPFALTEDYDAFTQKTGWLLTPSTPKVVRPTVHSRRPTL